MRVGNWCSSAPLATRARVAPRTVLVWAAFILTRPLGATGGDFLDKPVAQGGLDFSRPVATLALLVGLATFLILARGSPLAFPLMVEQFRERLSNESLAARVGRMVALLERAADEGDGGPAA